MGYTAGQFTGHVGLAGACVGGASVPRHTPALHHAHPGEAAALAHADAITPIRHLLVDTTPVLFAMAARAADQAPAATSVEELTDRVRALMRNEIARLDAVAQGLGADIIFCWDGPSVSILKQDATCERMRQRTLHSQHWHAEASGRKRERVLARYAAETAMHALPELYTHDGVDSLLEGINGHRRVSIDKALTSGRCAHVVALDEADCLLAQLALRRGQGASTVVLSNDSDLLVHACDDVAGSFRWVLRPAPVTSKPAANFGLMPPPFHYQHVFDRTLLGPELKSKFSKMFLPQFDAATYIVFVATGKTDYGNGFVGIGPRKLVKNGRFRSECRDAVGADTLERAQAASAPSSRRRPRTLPSCATLSRCTPQARTAPASTASTSWPMPRVARAASATDPAPPSATTTRRSTRCTSPSCPCGTRRSRTASPARSTRSSSECRRLSCRTHPRSSSRAARSRHRTRTLRQTSPRRRACGTRA
jgi:hypothetical protein